MKQIMFSSVFLLLAGFTSFAQKAPPSPAAKSKTQNIIIRKNGDDKEKTTIVIEGDKITVNGKPLDEYKGDLQIVENENSDFVVPAAPLFPTFPHGGTKSYSRSFSFTGNSAFLGVYTESDEAGAKIKSVTKDSPAEKAGLKEGDVITKIGTEKIEDADDLTDAVGKYKPEDKVTVTYLRDKKENSIAVTLVKNNQPAFAWSSDNNDFIKTFRNFSRNWDNKPHLGIRVEDVETGTGVRISDIDDDDAPAAKAGLKEDDIITQLNGKTVASVKDAKEILADLKRGDTVSVSYQRKGVAQTGSIHIPKPLESSDL